MDDTQTSGTSGYSQKSRLLAIDTPLGPDAVMLTTLEGEDVLSRCFQYRVTIETQQTDSAVQSLLGMPVTLWLHNEDPEQRRPIHGHVRRLVGQGFTSRGTRRYQLEVVPRLWFLSCTSDCRIFQNQSVPDILQTIFTEQGLADFEFRIMRADYPSVEYCVQYQETALDFVSRQMEHLGLFYWHEHSADKHLLVIADRNAAAAMCQPTELRISPLSGTDLLQSLDVECTFRPGKWALNDYDFQSPTKLLQVNAPTTLTVPRMINHEMYEYPGKFVDQDTGKQLSRLRIELEEAQQHRIFGTGRCAAFDPGRRFTVISGPGGKSTTYLLTEMRHHASAPGAETSENQANYTNDYVAIPADLPFRPERLTPKPFVRGAQTAVVVGPAGENIYCDQYGRVRVQFHWDRRGQRNDQSSCWLRVAQARAGANYGTLVIPHVGHEVLVSFIEGDPDRPLIIGTVPNALTMPPVVLPGDKDKTVQRDQGDNKIVMQGKAGQQHLSLVSPLAVNMFAAGSGARALSASDSFSTAPSSDTSGATSTSISIDSFQDPTGLNSLQANWNNVIAGDVTNYNLVEGSNSELNWGSGGRINCLSLGNTNNWINGDSNTWVNGTAHSKVLSGSNSLTYEYSISMVLGDSTSVVTGASESVVGGVNMAVNLGLMININIAGQLNMNIGPQFEWRPLHIDQAEVDIKALGVKLAATEAHIGSTNAVVLDTLAALHNNGITVYS